MKTNAARRFCYLATLLFLTVFQNGCLTESNRRIIPEGNPEFLPGIDIPGFTPEVKPKSTSGGNPMVSLTITSSAKSDPVATIRPIERMLNMCLPRAHALSTPGLFDSGGQLITLDMAWASFKDIEVISEVTTEKTTVFKGPYFIDLLTANPDELASGMKALETYRGIKMQLSKDGPLPAGAPIGLQGYSLFLRAKVSGRSFTFRSSETTTFEVFNTGGISLKESGRLLVSFQMTDLFKKINLSAVADGDEISNDNQVKAVNPCPEIDADADNLYSCFIQGLETQAKFAKDDDGDNEIDTDDHDNDEVDP